MTHWNTERSAGPDALPDNCEHQSGSYFDRSICTSPCGAAHKRCKDCGTPLDRCTFRPAERHWPMYVRWQHRHTVPAEVCDTCSDPKTGTWVPVSFCDIAVARIAINPDCTYSYGVLSLEEAPE